MTIWLYDSMTLWLFAGPWPRACQILGLWKVFFCFRFHQQMHIFSRMDSEMTHSRKRTQKWTQKWTAVSVSCSDNCFLFRKPRTRGGLSGSLGAWSYPRIVTRLRIGGHPFFEPFFEATFSLKIAILNENGIQNGPKMMSFGSSFWEEMWKRKNGFGLRRRVRIAYEPIPWSAQGDPQIEEKQGLISEPFF